MRLVLCFLLSVVFGACAHSEGRMGGSEQKGEGLHRSPLDVIRLRHGVRN